MGSILIEEICDQNHRKNEPVDILSTGYTNGNDFKSFMVDGIAADQTNAPTGMRDDILVLSWMILLLRTGEGNQIHFRWAYEGRPNSFEHQSENKCLSLDDIKAGAQSTVEQLATGISQHITTNASCTPSYISSPASFLLSNGSLCETSKEAKDERALQLEIRFSNGHLDIRPVYLAKNMPKYSVTRHIETLVDTIRMCIANPNTSIEDCVQPTIRDLDDIWGWNYLLPPTYNFCMHEMISKQAQRFSDKIAISSWDGDLTYAQIEQYSDTVAFSLKGMGVELHDFIPVCFEKSRWTIIAVLAVMKAGATFVLMDPTLPLARLQNMAKQVGAKAILASRQQHDLSTSIIPDGKLIVVEADTFARSSNFQLTPKLAVVPSSALMYIIFTSGSTGTPKGVKISHETYTSSAIPRAKAVGYTEDSRVLDFASYAFDVSIDSMLLTLGNGGCLCIPSDEDRVNDINGVIRNMQVNYAGLTPSVARILDPDVITSLSGLGLGGEAASARDVTLWGQDTRIIIGYGPCECTIGCTINSSAATGRDYISIGNGNGAAIWVVNPNDHKALMPVGAVGELLVEGPIVGQGYLNDPDKTAAAFIEDPPWLIAGHKGLSGRRGRLYKTGDLGKYDPDGSGGIVFVGRQDSQVKLRGQRVELSEIESQLKTLLPQGTNVIAEVIVSLGSGGQPTLVAFIATQSSKTNETTDITITQLHDEMCASLSKVDADLAKVLPRYMVPSAYIPTSYIPVLISGKTDRKRLRHFGTTVDLRLLDGSTTSVTTRQLNDIEQRLQQAWGEALKLDPETIRLHDNFFALGGDSLMAMRLVSVCRIAGLDLSVAITFSHPTLSEMASVVENCKNTQAQIETLPFSMITQDIRSACIEASKACGSDPTAIDDIHPCTPTQESLFTFSIRSTKAYVAQRIACIPTHISVDSWKRAWEKVVVESPILRTRLVQLQEPGLQQVILKESISWRGSLDLEQYLENDRNEKMDLGQSLARYAIVDNSKDGKLYMVWTVHHVLYDGWSEPIILKSVSNAIADQHTDTQANMRDFVKYVRDTDEGATQEFWRRELKGAVGPQFPRLPSRDYLSTPDALLEREIPLETIAGSSFTMATLIRGAWALVASQYSGSDDVVFGETLTGRDISLPGVESIVGPLIATVPVRINIQRSTSVESYLQNVQQGVMSRTPYQHMGWQNIRKVSRDAQFACEASTGLVIQPEPEYIGSELGFDHGDVVREALHFNPYPLMLACGIRKGGFRVCASFDSSLIEMAQMERILAQLEMACLQLTRDLSRKINDISCLTETQLNQIWQWNQLPPLSLDKSLKRLRADASIKQGSVYPSAVVHWVCNPRNPSLLSPIGSIGELWLEATFLSGETTESPQWLVAGSSPYAGRTGRLQSTGDIVQLRADGSVIFVGRKENLFPIQGHALDIADLEGHFTRHLPPSVRVAVAISNATLDGTQQKDGQELVVFIEQQPSEEESVELMAAKHDMTIDESAPQSLEMTICARITVGLVLALKRLDKFIQDSLPSHMVPSAWVVVERMSIGVEELNRHVLNELASKIPQRVLTQLHEGFKEAWTKSSAETKLTVSETILRSAWAKVLGITPEQIDVEDNFFRLGGDSVLAMKLVSSLRAQGHGLTVADIFQHMRLRDAAEVLKPGQVSREKAQIYKPFSTLGNLDLEPFLSSVVRPKLASQTWSIQDVLPATDSQALDIRATIQAPRTSIQYTMLYFDQGIDRENLFRACSELVKAHDILRTVFVEHESSFLQVVIDELDAPVTMRRAEIDLEQCVIELCKVEIESNFDQGSSFLKFLHVEGKNGQECLIIGLSHALYDGISLPLLLRDLDTLYSGGRILDLEPFSSYMTRIQDEHIQINALNYWSNLLKGSSLSVLNGTSGQPTDKSIFKTKPVDISGRPVEITTANLLTASWALVLARRIQKPDVTFGSITSGRSIDLANIENIMGPCYQFTPIRVTFESQWTAMDLLRFVQKQTAESAAHDFLGFDKISKQCAQWSSETRFFDSVVHHQDFEDFDTMPFAGGTCKVDILNPHGDAVHPLKVVSFFRDGQTHVGIVGSERDSVCVDATLGELVAAVEELSISWSEGLLLGGEVF